MCKKENIYMDNTMLFQQMNENTSDIANLYNDIIQNAYKVGESIIISYILNAVHKDNFTSDDIVKFLYDLMNNDEEIKDFVYEQMKYL